MKKSILLLAVFSFIILNSKAQTVTDYDGNIYNTTVIGTQRWMTENLNVLHYNDGSPIALVTGSTAWGNLTTGARCYYNNDSITNAAIYGSLYNWFTVADSNGICPIGWHIPSDAEFLTLLNYLGGASIAGGSLKDTGFSRWNSPNTGATNSSNFSGIGGGNRGTTGSFFSLRGFGDYWATTSSGSSAKDIALYYNGANVANGWTNKNFGFSVRCVSDTLISITSNDIHDADAEISIYPNPANSKIYINCKKKQNILLQISNLIGEIIQQKELNFDINEVDISSLPTGVYFVQLYGEHNTIKQKLIVIK